MNTIGFIALFGVGLLVVILVLTVVYISDRIADMDGKIDAHEQWHRDSQSRVPRPFPSKHG